MAAALPIFRTTSLICSISICSICYNLHVCVCMPGQSNPASINNKKKTKNIYFLQPTNHFRGFYQNKTRARIHLSVFLRHHHRVFAVHCTPPPHPHHNPPHSDLVVWWVWMLSCSSLSCIAPWYFHRASFLGHDLLPSGCSPSAFVESHKGASLLQPFIPLSDRFMGMIQWKVEKWEFALCTDWSARMPVWCELTACGFRDFQPSFCSSTEGRDTDCCVTLLWLGPCALLYNYFIQSS